VPVARRLAEEAHREISNLTRYGINVRPSKSGGFRIEHAGAKEASGGHILVSRLIAAAQDEGMRMISHCTCAGLLVSDQRCHGAIGFTAHGNRLVIVARAVVLASGGACHMFEHTTNPPGITGDGYALLLKAGAELTNVEFIRFFPLGLPQFRFPAHRPFRRFYDLEGLTVTNSRDEDIFQKHMGVSLKDGMSEAYSRFVTMSSVVTREGRSGEVFLDCTHVPENTWTDVRSMGPRNLVIRWGGSVEMWRSLLKNQRVPTAPIAQTFVGGAKVNSQMATDVTGLFACGEVVNFHFDLSSEPACEIGPLTCALVSGAIAGREATIACQRLKRPTPSSTDKAGAFKAIDAIANRKQGTLPEPIVDKIRRIMTAHAGPLRSASSLRAGIRKLNQLEPAIASVKARDYRQLTRALEVRNMALIARAVLEAALMREESRSEHVREDFPARDNDRWQKKIAVRVDSHNQLLLHTVTA
jgi:succinate dehydrogenase/fumarate reductase flavoprotein subunit